MSKTSGEEKKKEARDSRDPDKGGIHQGEKSAFHKKSCVTLIYVTKKIFLTKLVLLKECHKSA